MKKTIIATMILLFLPLSHVYGEEYGKTVEVKGIGGYSFSESSVDDQKQAAFVAAFINGAVGLVELVYGIQTKGDMTVHEGNVVSDTLIIELIQGIDDLHVSNNRLIKDAMVVMDLTNARFQGQTIVVNNGILLSPPVQTLKFPNWKSNPRTISTVEIRNINWNKMECEVTLAYTYDPLKILRKDEKRLLKTISFKLLKAVDDSYLYKKETIEGVAYGGGNDTPDMIRQKSLEQAIRNAIEKVNGVFIKSITEVKNSVVTKDEIYSQTMGVAQVINKQYKPQFTSEGNYQVTCVATVNVPLMELVAE